MKKQKKPIQLLKKVRIPFVPSSGSVMDINHDHEIEKLNIQLGEKFGTPVIRLEDWTKEGKERHLVTLHLGEALDLKAKIDQMLLNYVWDLTDALKYRITNLEEHKHHKDKEKDSKDCGECLFMGVTNEN